MPLPRIQRGELWVVPIPDSEIQETIAVEVWRRRTEARRLRSSAGAEWAATKARCKQGLLRIHDL